MKFLFALIAIVLGLAAYTLFNYVETHRIAVLVDTEWRWATNTGWQLLLHLWLPLLCACIFGFVISKSVAIWTVTKVKNLDQERHIENLTAKLEESRENEASTMQRVQNQLKRDTEQYRAFKAQVEEMGEELDRKRAQFERDKAQIHAQTEHMIRTAKAAQDEAEKETHKIRKKLTRFENTIHRLKSKVEFEKSKSEFDLRQ